MEISILGYKISLEVIILICVIYLILVGHTVCSCCNYNNIMEGLTNMKKNIKTLSTKKEGFTPANTNFGESSKYSLSHDTPVNTSSWHMQDLVVVPGETLSKGLK